MTEDLPWYCVHVKTKREHMAAAALQRLEGTQVVCPRLRYKKPTRRGPVWWVEAMFPGYIFVRCDYSTTARDIRHTQNVLRILEFGPTPATVPASFIEEIQRLTPEDDPVTLTPDIELGDELEIANGPFMGETGTVVEVPNGADRVKVLIEFLGNQQVVDVDLFSLLFSRKNA